MLLISSKPCEACGGTGKISRAAGSPQAGSPRADDPDDDAGDALVDFKVEEVKGNWVTAGTGSVKKATAKAR